MELRHTAGRLHLTLPGAEPQPVKAIRPLPLSEPHRVILLDDDNEEVLRLDDASGLDEEGQRVLAEALDERYYLPNIQAVTKTTTMFGTHYWDVVTDRGEVRFALREPGKNVTWVEPQVRCVIRDTVGNRFQIEDLQQLDPASRRRVLTIL